MRIGIVMVGPSPEVKGGIASVVRSYLQSDLPSRFRFFYVPSLVDGTTLAKLVTVIRGLARFVKILVIQRIHLCHIHFCSGTSFYRKSLFVLLAKLFRRKIIFHSHGGHFHLFYHQDSGPVGRWYIRTVLSFVDVTIVLSEGWKELFRALAPKSRLQILYNGLNGSELYPNLLSNAAASEKDGPVVLFMGRLERPKGIYDLIEAAPEIQKACPDVRFYLGGEGEIENIGELCAAQGLNQVVSLLGWVDGDRKMEVFHQAQVFVLPSYYEGLPMVILEAMASGLPVVATSVGGIPEVVEEGVNGYLIQPGDVDALVQRILLLLKDRRLREEIGDHNIQKIKTHFDMDVIIPQLAALYHGLVGGRAHV